MLDRTDLQQLRYWIFDMDGTLTYAMHDFDAIRSELGLPEGKPVLEALSEKPAEEASRLHLQLNEIELEIARESKPAEGAYDLLDQLTKRGCKLGILTRNNRINIDTTLAATGLDQFFASNEYISRDCAPHKPNPAGIHLLLERWQGRASQAVMIGDHLFDLKTGRAAQTTTIHVDVSGKFPHRTMADLSIQSLTELLDSLTFASKHLQWR